jgi:hypothetical protein
MNRRYHISVDSARTGAVCNDIASKSARTEVEGEHLTTNTAGNFGVVALLYIRVIDIHFNSGMLKSRAVCRLDVFSFECGC